MVLFLSVFTDLSPPVSLYGSDSSLQHCFPTDGIFLYSGYICHQVAKWSKTTENLMFWEETSRFRI